VHFRIRKNVVQCVRTTYDGQRKKPHAEVVGSIPLGRPVITPELREKLSEHELLQAMNWVEREQRTTLLREELAARTLAETLQAANRWFARQDDLADYEWISGSILPELQALRKTLKRALD
jgi:hypothetical protein